MRDTEHFALRVRDAEHDWRVAQPISVELDLCGKAPTPRLTNCVREHAPAKLGRSWRNNIYVDGTVVRNVLCRPQKPFWDDAPVENAKEDADINEKGYISVCFSLGLLCFTMAAVYRRDNSKAGYQAVLAELKRHWHERGQYLFIVSVETCNTVSFFQSENLPASLTTQRLLEWLSFTLVPEKGGRSVSNGFSEPCFQSPNPCSWQKHDWLWACRGRKVE